MNLASHSKLLYKYTKFWKSKDWGNLKTKFIKTTITNTCPNS